MDSLNDIKTRLSECAPSDDLKYDAVYLNTPWNKLNTEELSTLPLSDLCAENSSLFLWCDTFTAGDAAALLKKWDFDFHSVVQVLNVAEEAAPSVPVEEAAATISAPEPVEGEPAEVTDGEATETTAKPKTSKPRGARIKSIQPPSWWSSKEGFITRPCSEQLWMATRGTGAPLQTKGKQRPNPYQVRTLVDMSKKNSRLRRSSPSCPPDWFCSRPAEFLDIVSSALASSARILELFGDTISDKAFVFGPGIPGGFVPSLASDEGHVSIAKQAIADHGKVALRSICAKLHKSLISKEDPTADESVKAAFAKASASDSPLSSKWSDTAPQEELIHILSAVADYRLANYPSRRRKGKRAARTTETDGKPKVRHGIAAPGKVTPDLLEFLGEPAGTELARTDVVKRINTYIKENDLRSGKFIVMNDKLKALLNPVEGEPVTYFSLCRLLSPKFIKAEKKPVVPEADVENKENEPEAKRVKA